MSSNYSKLHEKEYDKLVIENEALLKENKRLKNIEKTLVSLTIKIDELIEINKQNLKEIKKKDELIKKLTEEIERLKNNNKKDSSNSSKPSSTNGSKIIPNNRPKSTKSKGGQKNHIAHTLKAKDVEELINDKENVKFIKNTIDDLNKKYPKYVLDLVTQVLVTENTGCNIDKLNEVQYGNNIKALVIFLAIDNYMSGDRIVDFIRILTNNKINLSKATVDNWINETSNSIEKEIEEIKNSLLNSYYIQADDSNIKVNKKNNFQLCICNKDSVLLYTSENKNKESWDKTILPLYTGILVKDGTSVYNKYNLKLAQCNVHISRYLKGCSDLSEGKHKCPMKLRSFLNGINYYRNKLIELGIESFPDKKIKNYYERYDKLIKLWGKELEGESKIIYKEEFKLHNRMKGKHKEEILFFINDFKIPFSNNNAEANQRGIKIKQKLGKFRSLEGAKNHCKIKSYILTLKKRKISILDSIKAILSGEPVLA